MLENDRAVGRCAGEVRQGRVGLREERGRTAKVKVGRRRLSGACGWHPQGQVGEKAEE